MRVLEIFNRRKIAQLWAEISRLNKHSEILTLEKAQAQAEIKHLTEFINASENILMYPVISQIGVEELLKQFKNDYFREFRIHPYVKEGFNLISDGSKILSEKFELEPFLQSEKLNKIFNNFGSDKGGRHNYGGVYETLIGEISNPTILEIGIGSENPYMYANGQSGGSLKAWREFYPHGVVIGADIDPDSVRSVKAPAFIVDQTDEISLQNLTRELMNYSELDFVIEDGFHDLHANIRTFNHIFPRVKTGGHYVIEDVHETMIDLWTVIGGYLNLDLKVFDLRKFRPGVSDNILVVIKKH
jgi:hypothetical protein